MVDPVPGLERPVVIMKFGGTSVATAEGRAAVAARVLAALEQNRWPVVVVSAMGRSGDPYATDTLLALVEGLPGDARERDLLASVGETISAIVVAHELRAAGVDAAALTGAEAGIFTDGAHDEASITEIDTGRLAALLAHKVVPVVCGFQGVNGEGSVTTLGRGGSDTTACALGVALGAVEVEIYTDVDGVMTTDPRTCEGAAVIESISADELFQMARAGSKVVHTPAAELALASGLSVRVRNTYRDHPGSRVTDIASYRPRAVATAVTQTSGVARLEIDLGADQGSPAHTAAQAAVYRAFADAGISLDMFTPAGSGLLLTVPETTVPRAMTVVERLSLTSVVAPGLAKVTLVGAGMHGVPGVVARVLEYLASAGVTVWQTADSHTTISVLVPRGDADAAVIALHEGFGLGSPSGASHIPV